MAFYNITKQEMESFLLGQGFQQMSLPRVSELVYGKIVKHGERKYSLRIYTAINPNGQSRAIGSDAIRVQLFAKNAKQEIHPVGRSRKCLRVTNWKANLQAAIDDKSKPW